MNNLLTTIEAAAQAGVKPRAIRNAIDRGALTNRGKGRDLFVDAEELQAWIDEPANHKPGPKAKKYDE